ncbi:amino acid ABC transporter permease [Xanthobacter tagetidis]|jgi:His/Glu/Gln/Arg/opine family amino acid ABC transporter permease subunit|uniref:Putative glutamine transport system permease protein GlnP n=1 Tax=Xanthobacter tagetidis TaxID=60216 RepID=A0A3L7AFC1_9HYPH|nr:amino acid ABC transporter permease [Xanthobacter tagetidis]MBB6305884.1 His/Glu/Gln/Arg/opine family amino acid ABC transporter permease subunit [Xanthobacter tagetidis]RLP78408.1 amino acid ABC transporter permease [Xanthobacter tagetidis]
MSIDWSVVQMAIPLLAEGTVMTLKIAAIAGILGLAGGVALGLISLGGLAPARWMVRAYVDFIRGTPLLIQIFIVFFGLPAMGLRLGEFWAGVIALSLNCAGYVAEVVRGTVGAVEKGQTEAAKSIGMTHGKILVYVLLPQSIRPMMPALTNDVITLLKNTSLLSVISVYELTRSGQAIIASHFAPVEIFTLLAIYYYAIISVLSWISRVIERRLPAW